MEQLTETVRNVLKDIIHKNNIHNFECDVSSASSKGDNYMGALYRIEVIGEQNGVRTALHLVCKVPPSDWSSKDINVRITFEREVYMYNVVLEQFKTFQIETGVPIEQRFTTYAVCHGADAEGKEQYVILEDLKSKSFAMFDKRSKLDRAHVQLVVEGLAKLHAISFAMKDQQPDIFSKCAEIPEIMIEVLGKKAYLDICDFGLNQAINALKCDDQRRKLEKLKENYEEIMENCLHGVGAEDYRVVTHGDCWNNNMMFRYENGIPVELCLLDWQIARFTSPVIDLSYYIYNSTEKEILDDHFDDLMDVYHDQLSRSIRLMGSDPEILYPRDVFHADMKRFSKFGVIMCTFGLNFMLAKPDTAPDVSQLLNATGSESMQNYAGFKDDHTKKVYARRIRDVIEHAAKRNFI